MSKHKKTLKSKIGVFLKQYARTSKCHIDPNDRQYDRSLERKIKQMKPEELADLMYGDDDEA